DDDRRREKLVLAWPLDLLELADRLRDEAAEATAALAAGAGLALRLAARLDLAPALAGALCGSLVVVAPAARAGLAGHGLPRLPMQGVGGAPAAVLLRLEPVGRVPFRFLCLIVAPLAFRARKRDRHSYSCCQCRFLRLFGTLK